MVDKVFLDTNILIYCYSQDEVQKNMIALNLLETIPFCTISTQVINELSNILFKKFKLPAYDIENALLEVDNILNIVTFSLTTQIKAIRIKEKYKLQYYDSLIIATALENECTVLYSEDMHDGLVIENSLKIINPFIEKM